MLVKGSKKRWPRMPIVKHFSSLKQRSRTGNVGWWARFELPILVGYTAIMTAATLALALAARKKPYFAVDLDISRRLQSIRVPGFDALMRFIAGLGYPMQANILGGLLLAFLYRIGLRLEASTTLIGVIGSCILAFALLLMVRRPRPTPDLIRVNHKMWTTSFPSGHTLIFTSIVGFLWFLAYKSRLPAPVRLPLLVVFGAVVLLMGPARVYSGEHWASDVVAGYLMGSAWLGVLVKLYRWRRGKHFA